MPEILFSGIGLFGSFALSRGVNAMKKIALFSNVALGIFWEAVYVMVVIAVGLMLSFAIQYIL